MRAFLIVVVVIEAVALLGLGAAHASGALDAYHVPLPEVPVFEIPAYDAVNGDLVRYARYDKETGAPRGYLEYKVLAAIEYKGSQRGRELQLEMTRTDARGQKSVRLIALLPRAPSHGYLPPVFQDSDDYPAGARPLIKRIRSATVGARYAFRSGEWVAQRTGPGFILDAITPRKSLTEITDRFYLTKAVPIFGVSRWERGDEILVVHRDDRGGE